jgi:hypothetical protein
MDRVVITNTISESEPVQAMSLLEFLQTNEADVCAEVVRLRCGESVAYIGSLVERVSEHDCCHCQEPIGAVLVEDAHGRTFCGSTCEENFRERASESAYRAFHAG